MSRVVMFVNHDVTHDSRVLREAATLAAAGHRVTIMAGQAPHALVPLEERDGFEIRGVPLVIDWSRRGIAGAPARLASAAADVADTVVDAGIGAARAGLNALGPERRAFLQQHVGFRRHLPGARRRARQRAAAAAAPGAPESAVAASPPASATPAPAVVATPVPAASGTPAAASPTPRRRRRRWRRGPTRNMHNDTWLWLRSWRYGVVGWAEAAAAAAPPADVWHAHDMPTLPAAIRARTRHGGAIVYDSHELFLESGTHATRPDWARRLLLRFERRWAREADATVTVNESIATELVRRLRVRRPIVVRNCPPRWLPDTLEPPRFDRFRELLGIPADRTILLHQGRFSVRKGIETMVDALVDPALSSCVGVFLGYGPLRGWLIEQAARPELAGRIFVVDAVPPDQLLPWTASADMSVMAIERDTMNHYLVSPNKLWESLAAGVPVVASDFPELRGVVEDVGAGELCDPDDRASIATAVGRILALTPEDRLELRRRCRTAALERYNWEIEGQRLVDLYARLTQRAAA